MKEVKRYLNPALWPDTTQGLRVSELLELIAICEAKAEGMSSKDALHYAVMNAAGAAFACGYERGQKKTRRTIRRAEKKRIEKATKENATA